MDASLLRQSQINEWYYHMKLESLFISQLFFVGLSFVIVMFSLSKTGIFGKDIIYYSIVIIVIILFCIWLTRYLYNRNTRDMRDWSKRRFAGDYTKPATIPSEVVSLQANIASCKV